MATYLYEAPGDCYAAEASSKGQTNRRAFKSKLRAGDTLVVSSLGSLGETYAAITDEMRDLMRRRILVRAVNEGLTFDGTVDDVGAQASRDALIGFAAAAVETKNLARHGAVKPVRFFPQPGPVGGARPTGLRLGTVGIQLAALLLAAYFIGLALHRSHQREQTTASLTADRQIPLSLPQSNERERYATKDFLFEKTPEAASGPGDELKPSPQAGSSAADNATQEDTNVARQALGLSRDRELRIFSSVGDWRSAKVRGRSFPITAGSAVPPGVHLATFPRSLVRAEPSLRGYKFVVDDQLIGVVDPAERKIVAVLTGPAASSRP